MIEYPQREVFRRTPLEYVACGIQYPLAPRLGRDETLEALSDRLSSILPIPEVENVGSLTVGPGEARTDNERRFRFLDLPRHKSVVVGRHSLFIETTNYREYPEFRDLVAEALLAVAEVGPVVGVERVGLRYIDEVRVPSEVESANDWRGWITDEVLSVLTVSDQFEVQQMETSLRLNTDGIMATLRYASLTGPGVVGNQPLRRRSNPKDGPFFLIDIDSFWSQEGTEMAKFEPANLLELLDRLHAPIGTLFHRSISNRLREELRRSE